MADCPKPMVCNRCGAEGHLVRECTEEEKTRQFVDEEGKTQEIYVPGAEIDAAELYKQGIQSGINFSKYENIPVQVTGENVVEAISSFNEIGLRKLLIDNLSKSDYQVPTPIQKHAIPNIMQSRDLMACAQTGSGKTAAFLLPIIHKLIEAEAESLGCAGLPTQTPQCVVVTPTRELAIQIHNEARKFAQGSLIKSVVVYGGTSVNYQSAQMGKGCNILVATPGRLMDYVERGKISFSCLKFLVLDEADRMLDMGFMPDIKRAVETSSMPDKGER